MKTTTNDSNDTKKFFDDFIEKEVKEGNLDTGFAKFREEIGKLKPVKDD